MEMEVWLMNGLVLEGGTFRPIFSSGVMDALLTEDIMLPYCIAQHIQLQKIFGTMEASNA